MRILDLLRMSSANLWKRKVRTLLTILGVVIGTASIVVMVSLGLGLNKATMEDIEQYGGLTTIEVREGRGDSSSYTTYSIGGGGSVTFSSDSGSSSSKDKVMRLDDAAVSLLESLDHVENVYPVLQLNIVAKYGQYVDDYMTIQGMTPEGLQALNIESETVSCRWMTRSCSFFTEIGLRQIFIIREPMNIPIMIRVYLQSIL